MSAFRDLSVMDGAVHLYSSIVGKNQVVCRHLMSLIYKHLSTDNRLAAENNAGYTHNARTVGTVDCDWSSALIRTITLFALFYCLQWRVKSVRPGESDWPIGSSIIMAGFLVHSNAA